MTLRLKESSINTMSVTPKQILNSALKAKVELDSHIGDYDESEDDWRLGNYIPSTYMEDGIRKIYVWDEDIEQRYEYKDGQLVDLKPETF